MQKRRAVYESLERLKEKLRKITNRNISIIIRMLIQEKAIGEYPIA